jgi:hypothetical protein
MKKVLTIAIMLTLLFAVSNLFAQAPTTGITGKGFKVGINLAKSTGSDATNAKTRIGGAFGGFITYSINDLFAIQPEIFFTAKGSKRDVTGGTASVKLNYLEIPVLFRVQLAGGTSFKPNFYAGPEIAFLLTAKYSPASGGDMDVKNDYKSTDFGLIGGVGAEYPIGSGKLLVDIRYDAGLSKVVKLTPVQNLKNSAITFLVGYGF